MKEDLHSDRNYPEKNLSDNIFKINNNRPHTGKVHSSVQAPSAEKVGANC